MCVCHPELHIYPQRTNLLQHVTRTSSPRLLRCSDGCPRPSISLLPLIPFNARHPLLYASLNTNIMATFHCFSQLESLSKLITFPKLFIYAKSSSGVKLNRYLPLALAPKKMRMKNPWISLSTGERVGWKTWQKPYSTCFHQNRADKAPSIFAGEKWRACGYIATLASSPWSFLGGERYFATKSI
jgi:hypothetical protein